MKYYWNHYLERDLDAIHPYASPLKRRTLEGLPPALVVTGGFDPLRDDGFQYAERLKQSNVPTDHLHYPDMNHGIFNPAYFLKGIDSAVNAISEICEKIELGFQGRDI